MELKRFYYRIYPWHIAMGIVIFTMLLVITILIIYSGDFSIIYSPLGKILLSCFFVALMIELFLVNLKRRIIKYLKRKTGRNKNETKRSCWPPQIVESKFPQYLQGEVGSIRHIINCTQRYYWVLILRSDKGMKGSACTVDDCTELLAISKKQYKLNGFSKPDQCDEIRFWEDGKTYDPWGYRYF